MARIHELALVFPLLLACQPEFDNRFSAVDSPRMLAVQASPAEVTPGTNMTFRTLVADAQGTVDTPDIHWSFCTQPKPSSELNDVSTQCFGSGDAVMPFATGPTAMGAMPKNACRQFGPDIPQTMPGEPPGRPTDADSSGGYYQPLILSVKVDDQNIDTLAEARITCGLANASGSQLEEYRARSKPNENPRLTQVIATTLDDARLQNGADAALKVQHGATITLRASWPSCPTEPACGDGMCTSGEDSTACPDDCLQPIGCTGPEEYAYLDPSSGAIVTRHESMRVSWFTTQGTFRDDRTGSLEADFAVTTSDNTWTAPNTPGPVFMWVVLRDDRGGSDWQSYQLQVE